MHIALCDDEQTDLQTLHILLKQYDQKSQRKRQILGRMDGYEIMES